jgi:hypothetical protein
MKYRYQVAGAVLSSAALVLTGLAGPALANGGSSGNNGPQKNVAYSSAVNNPGNLPSVGAEAYAFNEFGNQVTLAGTNRHLDSVVVTLSSWGCVSGHWNTGDCATPNNATFATPMTLNIYNAPVAGSSVHGSLIASLTQSYDIPYRPSASKQCVGGNVGEWYDRDLKTCFNGLATDITFAFNNTTLPSSVVYGIAYNTTHYGYSPIGQSATCYTTSAGCGYDALNIGLASTSPSAGSNTNPGTVWQNSSIGGQYCDGGAGGTNTFRLDSPGSTCWAPYSPAVQFNASRGNN